MENLLDNPLFLICREKFRADLNAGTHGLTEADEMKYWLGFCRGVSHACDVHSAGIESVSNAFKQIEKNNFRS